MTKIVGIVGSGMIGRDPWDPNCWSRSGFNLFSKLKEHGHLETAIGVEVPFSLRVPIMLKNFSTPKRRWRQKFNLDPLYYHLLTKEIARAHKANPFPNNCALLQIGGHYNAAKATGLPSFSYHDGNIAGLMTSPFFAKDLTPYARRAFEFEKATYRDMTKIFVMSEYWRHSFIQNFAIPQEKVVNVGFGVNIPVPDVFVKDHNTKNVVFVGIDFSRKGGDNLVKAFNKVVSTTRHTDAKLHIIGPKERPAILDNFSTGVEYYGHLSRENPAEKAVIEKVLREGNVFVLPSLYEPFGNAALEAMLYRMPAITTNDWSFPDFVIPGKTGCLLTKCGDINEIAEAILHLLDDTESRKNYGENGYKLVTEKYTWDATINNIVSEINSST